MSSETIQEAQTAPRAAEKLFLRQYSVDHTYDHQVAIQQLMSLAQRVARCNGFYDDYAGNAAQLCNIHEEVSEANWALRHNRPASEKIPEYENLTEEMADIIWRVLDFCEYNHLPLAQAMQAKFLYNISREYKHGKTF
jgi:NTP pyrophosphatase (non-canonical NTP hydrolase)